MSGILTRTIFIGSGGDGYIRISPWCRVVTQVGAMMEPLSNNMDKIGGNDFDWKDAGNRIDGIEGFEPAYTTFGDNTIGGPLVPVKGY